MKNMRKYAKKVRFFTLLFIVSISALLLSCKNNEPPRMVVGRDFYYWESSAEANLGDAFRNAPNFKKLENYSANNLRDVLGREAHYVWIRLEFEIPPEFKGYPLGLVVPHLKFAEQLWCNGTFISQYGVFPPHEQSTMFKAHFFSLPMTVLNQEGKNTIFIRIFAQGNSGISSHSFIQPTQFAYAAFEQINFNHTRIYMFLIGSLHFSFILFMCFFILIRDFREFRDFALLNLFTSLFLVPFFSTELPAYTDGTIPFLIFIKLFMCIPACLMAYFATLFVIDYHHKKYGIRPKIIRAAALLIQVVTIVSAKSYVGLMKTMPIVLVMELFQLWIAIPIVIKDFFDKETRKNSVEITLGFSPLLLGAISDITIRLIDNTWMYPHFSIFGWQVSIIVFIILLAMRFAKIYRHNERLSNHLTEEVAAATLDLQDANYELSLLNERLEKDKKHSEMDLEMASVIQRNFFPRPNKHFRGWEIAVCYSPATKVSGDFYDYYNYNDVLNGISLFDVSGHGLSASLVTMLSKNIISRMFQSGYRRGEAIDKVLDKINNMILYEKGDIDNYMTGILCRFDENEDSKICNVELGNAGHPYPLKYSVRDNEVYELKGNDGKKHYGAIGMKGITVSFARSIFSMATGDILVLYTDGITEATNSQQVQFGTEHIKEIIKTHHAKAAGEIVGHIIERLEEFTEYRPFEDDITLIIAKRTNTAEFVADDEEDEEDRVEELAEAEENPDDEKEM